MEDPVPIILDKVDIHKRIDTETAISLLDSIIEKGRTTPPKAVINLKRTGRPKDMVLFMGDTHGDFYTTKKLAVTYLASEEDLNTNRLVFLGDYVDRAPKGIEFGSFRNILYLLALRLKYPDNVFLLRGNHETHSFMPYHPYDFPDELEGLYGDKWREVVDKFDEVFKQLPIALTTENGIFASHGGLPPPRISEGAGNPLDLDINDAEVVLHLAWGDPEESGTYRGEISKETTFNQKRVVDFLDRIGKTVFLRGHDYHTLGYSMYGGRMFTVFTSERYRARGNSGVLFVRTDMNKKVASLADLEVKNIDEGKVKVYNPMGFKKDG